MSKFREDVGDGLIRRTMKVMVVLLNLKKKKVIVVIMEKIYLKTRILVMKMAVK